MKYIPLRLLHILKIPIAHIYGGETTQGVIDEGIRHSITKLSHIHFVSTNRYLKRESN